MISKLIKLAQKEHKSKHCTMEGNPLRTVPEIKILPYSQIVYSQNRISPKKRDLWNSLGFWSHRIPASWPELVSIQKNKRACHILNIAVPPGSRMKVKRGEKIDKYTDLAKEPRKLWKVKVTSWLVCLEQFPKGWKGDFMNCRSWHFKDKLEDLDES